MHFVFVKITSDNDIIAYHFYGTDCVDTIYDDLLDEECDLIGIVDDLSDLENVCLEYAKQSEQWC